MKSFLKIPRAEPERRPATERLKDWSEMYIPISQSSHLAQGKRCMDCGVPFCQSSSGCPVDNLIPEWNELSAQGKMREALERLHLTNNFPEFTGRLCPAPCETACVLGINQAPVAIRAIEQSLVDLGFKESWIKPQTAKIKTNKRIAIIGSGPAGLAAAQQLARLGHKVIVFEKQNKLGGLLRYGIPDFKMEKSIIDRRIQQLSDEGVEFKTGMTLGKDLSIKSLKQDFDSIGICIGAERPRSLNIPGNELIGIYNSMDFLISQNKLNSNEIQKLKINSVGKKVIILGGGDTGSDVLGTVLRQNAESVIQIEILPKPPQSRSQKTPWPLWPHQIRNSHAHEEGGTRIWAHKTLRFLGNSAGQVTSIEVQKLVDHEQNQPESNTAYQIECDLVFLALGFTGLDSSGLPEGLINSKNLITTSSNMMTAEAGVFAAGDARRGASLIVWAIQEGRQMAQNINEFLLKN